MAWRRVSHSQVRGSEYQEAGTCLFGRGLAWELLSLGRDTGAVVPLFYHKKPEADKE